jgi:hypothetical protein
LELPTSSFEAPNLFNWGFLYIPQLNTGINACPCRITQLLPGTLDIATQYCNLHLQAFAAAGHASSGSLGVMGSGPLGGGAMQQQQQPPQAPDAGRPFMPSPGPHAAAFGQPGQQHGGHAFFNQVRCRRLMSSVFRSNFC